MSGQLFVQWLVLLWLWGRQPADLHRGMLRLAQVLYGLGATVGQVLLYLLINPGFLRVWFGQIIVGLSVIMAAIFAILAQIKLHRAPQEQDPLVKLELAAQDVAEAGRAVVIILWLLADALTIRVLYNLPHVTVSATSASLPDKPVALDSVLIRALPPGRFAVVDLPGGFYSGQLPAAPVGGVVCDALGAPVGRERAGSGKRRVS